jgi:hypothetical protein
MMMDAMPIGAHWLGSSVFAWHLTGKPALGLRGFTETVMRERPWPDGRERLAGDVDC